MVARQGQELNSAMTSNDNDIRKAYAECRDLTRRHYENFSIATFLLPRRIHRHMHALYGFARGVDDIGDEAPGDRLARLDWWEAHLLAVFDRGDAPPGDRPAVFIALEQTGRELNLPPEPFLRLIEANRRDQQVKRYGTFQELMEYCTYSADPVGRLVLAIFGYRDESLYPYSDATCTALQLANFWQDVARDFAMGRIYIPGEDMERFGVTEDTLEGGRATPAFRELLRFQVERTRELFSRGRPLIAEVAGRFSMDLLLFTRGGEAVLDAIEAQDFDVLRKRPVISGVKKAGLLLSGSFNYLMKMEL